VKPFEGTSFVEFARVFADCYGIFTSARDS
jgi:hypothetical protein